MRIPISDAPDVDAAVIAAKEAFPAWSRTSRKIRSGYLQKIATLLEENKELFAVWESIDQGQTIQRARIEVDRAVSNFQCVNPAFFSYRTRLRIFALSHANRYFSTFILHEDHRARMVDYVALTYEHRSAIGPFALISPWNMPLYLLT